MHLAMDLSSGRNGDIVVGCSGRSRFALPACGGARSRRHIYGRLWMSGNKRCPRCGSVNLEPGELNASADYIGRVQFKPAHKRFFTLRTGVAVTAIVCMDCGLLEMNADTELLRKILPQEETSASESTEDPVEPIQCLQCGAKIDAGESKCSQCGWRYTSL